MDFYPKPGREGFPSVGSDYLNYAFMAQQEMLQFGMNLFQRQIDTGRKIAESQDLTQALGAWTNLARETVDDFSAVTARLIGQASAAGSKATEKRDETFRASPQQPKRAAEAASDQAAAAQKATETAEKPATASEEPLRSRKQSRE